MILRAQFVRPPSLPPEYIAALTQLEELFPRIRPNTLRSTLPSLEELIEPNNAIFVARRVTSASLPRQEGWVWSQSRRKERTQDTTNCLEVEFYKLYARKLPSAPRSGVPTCKLWVYHLHVPELEVEVSVLWCEDTRGPRGDMTV